MTRSYALALTLGLALLNNTSEAQQAGGVSLNPQGKQHTTLLQTPRVLRTSAGQVGPVTQKAPADQLQAKPGRLPSHQNLESRGTGPVNDNCVGAIALTVGTACNPVTGDVAGATQSIAAILCNGYTGTAEDDVWYSFVANAATMTVEVTGSADFDAVVDLRSGGCNGTNIACGDVTFDGGTEFINATGLTVGSTYFVRVFDWYDTAPPSTTFDICVYSTPAAPANDNCGGAIALTVGSSCSPVTGNATSATESLPALACNAFTGNANDDVWYSFVATATALTIEVAGSAGYDAVVDLRSGACPGTNIACADATVAGDVETINATGLTVGNTYRVRVYDYAAGAPASPTFDICVFLTPAAPANDECADATIQALNVPGSVTVNGDNTGATDSEGIGFNTVWEAFTITACADVTIEYCGTTPAFEEYVINLVDDCLFTTVYDTSSTGTCADTNPLLVFNGLAAGTYYYPVLESSLASGPYSITFTAVACGGGTTPPNDECADATIQALNVPGTVAVSGDNTGATDSENIGFNTVWEAFTITECADITVDYCGTSPAFGQWFVNLVDDCAFTTVFDPSAADTCADGNSSLLFLGLSAGTYYYPVLESNLATGPYTVNFSATACPNPPANDDCAGAIVLDVELTCTPVTGTTLGATESFPADSCAGIDVGAANDDVWYSFVATGTEHTITVDGDSLLDAVVQAYSGTCGGTTFIGCADQTLDGEVEDLLLTNLTIGETYFVRVFHWYLANTISPTFTICITGDVATGVLENSAAAWTVFPNPTEGFLTVVNGGSANAAILELFDVAGRLVVTERTSLAKGEQHSLELGSKLVAGTYSLRVTTADGRSTQRVVVR